MCWNLRRIDSHRALTAHFKLCHIQLLVTVLASQPGLFLSLQPRCSPIKPRWRQHLCQPEHERFHPAISFSPIAHDFPRHLLCTTIDLIAANQVSAQPSFSYFIQEVNHPLIARFDLVNWSKVKIYMTKLASREQSVASAILAVHALYQAQIKGLSMSYSMALYRIASTRLATGLERPLSRLQHHFSCCVPIMSVRDGCPGRHLLDTMSIGREVCEEAAGLVLARRPFTMVITH